MVNTTDGRSSNTDRLQPTPAAANAPTSSRSCGGSTGSCSRVGTLVGYGLWAVAGITRFDVAGDQNYYVVRQGIAAALGGAASSSRSSRPAAYRRWQRIYVGTVSLMVSSSSLAEANRGSKRWIDLGPFQFQPSEFGKLLFVLALAGFLAERAPARRAANGVLRRSGSALLPMVLVFKQPDIGTSLVYAAALAAVLFLAGVRWTHLAALARARRSSRARVAVVPPGSGCRGARAVPEGASDRLHESGRGPGGLTYNVSQSITAVGSGGFDGRGVAEATQTRLDYLPEHATDFVFASFAEQRGFVGAAILLLPLPARRLAGPSCRHRRRRPVQRGRRRRDRLRVPVPGVRQRRHDDGNRARDRHPVAVRHPWVARRWWRTSSRSGSSRRSTPRGRDRHPAPVTPLRHRSGAHVVSLARHAPRVAARSTPAPSSRASRASSSRTPLARRRRPRARPATATRRGRGRSCALSRAPRRDEDEAQLRAATRALMPVVVVQTGIRRQLPYVLATDIVAVPPGGGFPIEEIADGVAVALGADGRRSPPGSPCCARRERATLITRSSRRRRSRR